MSTMAPGKVVGYDHYPTSELLLNAWMHCVGEWLPTGTCFVMKCTCCPCHLNVCVCVFGRKAKRKSTILLQGSLQIPLYYPVALWPDVSWRDFLGFKVIFPRGIAEIGNLQRLAFCRGRLGLLLTIESFMKDDVSKSADNSSSGQFPNSPNQKLLRFGQDVQPTACGC